ncbi:MAG: rod shape-determining protein MreC [Sphingobacteriales bacterium 17-39-43]|uniref:rod shape-determining protein MreC n=1 Tax=Daejeonella sp. TaxID=2805397 RepID=UPI000BC74631|nr:rod shape-determining protein MreC [Daejeonella sp.]OYZ30633.1 MAG: rod shape-determining protein MreC [Sphingobacteriales bacterium 16-39-50]OZA23354.1 MAG: rod shape-determining protein MreC [Sphingobacteriales bacterium 17-39-43]HQT23878.1 rod shape-determining protein MreC [Daejeonella sp.]HQT56625.1 rod shape-determining protein MreC [Daejeonella sp.]
MRNLWLFISKYNAFFLLVIFFTISLILLINNNSYQRASVWNSSNQIVGTAYERVNEFSSYLVLGKTNDSLAAENARLRNLLKSSYYDDSVKQITVKDSVLKQQYTYTVARVINNSVHQKNNYLTINRGSKHGIKKGMGVIASSGVVGIILNVSENFSTVRSLLHTETKISASVDGNIGSLVWGEGNYDSRFALLKDIQSHLTIKKGARVITSEFSLFPPGTNIGSVSESDTRDGNSALNIKVKLDTDFAKLQYVYVIINLLSEEQLNLEAQNKVE